MYLYHYFDKRDGPFRNLSDCATKGEATEVLLRLHSERPGAQLTGRMDIIYMDRRQV